MNQVMTLGCISKRMMETYAVQVFCMSTWDHCCLIYHKKKILFKYHYLEEKIIRQIIWCKKKSYRIFDISMSKKQRLYFLLCQDWFIYFLNFEFQIVNKVQLECKQFTNLLFLDHLNTFVMVQFKSVSTFQVEMKERFKIVKYQELPGSLEWNRQCKQQDYFYILYNSQNITIYDMRTIQHVGSIQLGITISDFYYINDLLYMGDVYGTLWCYDLNGILQHYYEHAHEGSIVSMTVHKDELFTVANDLIIKVWKLSNLLPCQSYPIYQLQIQYFKFINYSKYFLQSADELFICDLNHILQAYYLHNSSVCAVSNQCIAFKNHLLYSNITQRVIFPSKTSKSPKHMLLSFIKLNFSQMCQQLQQFSIIPLQQTEVFSFDKIRTINGDKINQEITFVQIATISPPLYDVELTIDSNDQIKISKMINNADQSLFFILGCSKGAVLCVPFENFTIIYTRINYNKAAIQNIFHFNDQLVINSIDNVINFVQIHSNKTQLIKSFKLFNLGPIHLTHSKQLAIAISNELFVFNSNLTAYETSSGHENDILQITSNKTYIISNSLQQMKIWTANGFCIYTINFHVQIDFIYYLKDDLIIIDFDELTLPAQMEDFVIYPYQNMKQQRLIPMNIIKSKQSIWQYPKNSHPKGENPNSYRNNHLFHNILNQKIPQNYHQLNQRFIHNLMKPPRLQSEINLVLIKLQLIKVLTLAHLILKFLLVEVLIADINQQKKPVLSYLLYLNKGKTLRYLISTSIVKSQEENQEIKENRLMIERMWKIFYNQIEQQNLKDFFILKISNFNQLKLQYYLRVKISNEIQPNINEINQSMTTQISFINWKSFNLLLLILHTNLYLIYNIIQQQRINYEKQFIPSMCLNDIQYKQIQVIPTYMKNLLTCDCQQVKEERIKKYFNVSKEQQKMQNNNQGIEQQSLQTIIVFNIVQSQQITIPSYFTFSWFIALIVFIFQSFCTKIFSEKERD